MEHGSDRQPSPLDYGTSDTAELSPVQRLILWFGVAFTIVLFLILLLQPSQGRPREPAQRIKCGANLKAIGQGLMLYALDHGGRFPDSIPTLLTHVDITAETFICPSCGDDRANGASAAENIAIIAAKGFPDAYALSRSRPPMHLSFIYCGQGLTTAASADTILAYEPLSNHDGAGINVLYGNGGVRFLSRMEATHTINELQAAHNPPRATAVGIGGQW